MVEIFLFPVRVIGGSRLHLSTTQPAAAGSCQPQWDTAGWLSRQFQSGLPPGEPLPMKQEGWQTCSARWPCSPCLPDHPRRNWPQDPLHHGQVLPVVMCLGERNVRRRHAIDSSGSASSPGYSPTQNPFLANTSGASTRLEGLPSVPGPLGCAGKQPASSHQLGSTHTTQFSPGKG